MRIQNNNDEMIRTREPHLKPVDWILLFLWVFCYIALSIIIIYLTLQQKANFYLSGILAQGQVLAAILITLNPIKRSHWIAFLLCGLSVIITLQRIISTGIMNMLPGVLIPITSIVICVIINRFKERSSQNEKSLVLANELLQKVLDTIPMPIFWKDLNSNFLGCNQYFAKEAGISSPEQLIGKDDYDTPSFEQTEKYRADDTEIMSSGISKINIEELHTTGNGVRGWIRTTKVPLRDANGDIFGLLGVFEDITKKKLAEQELYYEKERLRVTLLAIGDAVITTDQYKKITLINSVAEELTGWRAEDALGKVIDLVLNLENELTGEKERNPIEEVLCECKTVRLENRTLIISKQGEKRIIEDSATPILGADGDIQGAVMVFRDVTDKKIKQDEIVFLSYHDSLTTLYNRRYVEEKIKQLEEQENYPLSIILGDINGLKWLTMFWAIMKETDS